MITIKRKSLTIVYAAVAALALIGTWSNNLQLLQAGLYNANVQFWRDTLATPVSRSITVDIFWFGLPVIVWMVFEARKLKMRGVWLYVIGGFLVAISVTTPLFLIHRDRILSRTEPNAGELHVGDIVGLVLLGLLASLYTAFALR